MSPFAARRQCSKSGCPLLAKVGSRCEDHAKVQREEQDEWRESSWDRGYDNRWQKVRKMKLAASPVCERCGTSAALVHHKDRDSGNSLADNLESLCFFCHKEEHRN